MHKFALYLKTNSFTISIMHFIGSAFYRQQHQAAQKRTEEIGVVRAEKRENGGSSLAASRQPVCPPRAPHWARLPRHLAGSSCPHRRSVKKI